MRCKPFDAWHDMIMLQAPRNLLCSGCVSAGTIKQDFCSKGFSSMAGTCYGVAPQLKCMSSMQMDVQAGVGYGIVVDGFAGKFGTYQITVSAAQVLVLAGTALPKRQC